MRLAHGLGEQIVVELTEHAPIADYDAYRQGCRRDDRLAQVWKPVG